MTHAPEVTRVAKLHTEARLIIDARGQIRDANEAAHRLLDFRAGTLIGLSLAWIMPPTRHTLMGELIQVFKEGAQRSLPGVLMRDDGSLILVIMTTPPYTGPRGRELAVSLELDEEPASTVQRVGLPGASAPAALPSTLPPPSSRQVAAPARPAEAQRLDVTEQLAACTELLSWLDGQLQRPGARETPQERAFARVVLQEASQLIERCQSALRVEPQTK